jgi:hypothetical protein
MLCTVDCLFAASHIFILRCLRPVGTVSAHVAHYSCHVYCLRSLHLPGDMLWTAAGNESLAFSKDFSFIACSFGAEAVQRAGTPTCDHEATQACGHACMLCLVSVFPKAGVAGLARTGDCRRNCIQRSAGPGRHCVRIRVRLL